MSAKKGRVLCIDDEPHVLRALQWLLQKDFEVHTCESAGEALRMLRAHDFDVVVSDQRMPGITGVELLRHVRKLAPRAMRILLTGYSDLDAMVKSVNESEVYRFVTKPWDVRTLPKLIAEAAEVARSEPAPPDSGAAREAAQPAREEPAAGATEALLVMDDRPELHALAGQVLAPAMEVLHAYDLPQALTLLDSRPIAVIVSEVAIGGKDATRLLRLMKANHPQTVALVASDQNDAETVMSLINQGQVFRIIPKPVKPAFLKLLVEAALKRHRELVGTPSLRRRFAVESTAQEVARSLYEDIIATAPPPRAPSPLPARPPALRPAFGHAAGARVAQTGAVQLAGAAPQRSVVDSLKAGFRRLFGAATA